MNKQPTVSPDKRRYDSLSVLIQGDAVCGACCFDGENLIPATNHALETELVKNVVSYLKGVAHEGWSRNHLKNTDKGRLIKYVQSNVDLMKNNKTYESRFQASLDKVTHSLKCSYLEPDAAVAFPIEVAEAIRTGRVIFLTQLKKSSEKRTIHAEMQILDYLYFDRRKILNSQITLYIGVSKKCCANCEVAIQSINSVKNVNIVEVRGVGHGFSFSADIPNFLKGDAKIKTEFLRFRKVQKLEDVFNKNDKGRIEGEDQLHTPSSSVYDSTSAHGESLEIAESVDDEVPQNIVKFIKKPEPNVKPKKTQKNKKSRNRRKNKKMIDSALNSPARFFINTKNGQKKIIDRSTSISSNTKSI